MFNWIVHVERKRIEGIVIRDPNGTRYEAFNTLSEVSIDGSLHGIEGNEESLETWYVNTEANAQMLAAKMAQQKPGYNVYICELKAIAVCAPGKVSVSKLSEKGLVP